MNDLICRAIAHLYMFHNPASTPNTSKEALSFSSWLHNAKLAFLTKDLVVYEAIEYQDATTILELMRHMGRISFSELTKLNLSTAQIMALLELATIEIQLT